MFYKSSTQITVPKKSNMKKSMWTNDWIIKLELTENMCNFRTPLPLQRQQHNECHLLIVAMREREREKFRRILMRNFCRLWMLHNPPSVFKWLTAWGKTFYLLNDHPTHHITPSPSCKRKMDKRKEVKINIQNYSEKDRETERQKQWKTYRTRKKWRRRKEKKD